MMEAFPGGLTGPLDWMNGVTALAPNLGPDMIKHTILTKVREFFQLSQCWRDWVGPITLHSDTPFYSVETSDYKAEMISILGGYRLWDQIRLRPVANSCIDTDAMVNDPAPGDPLYYYRTPEGLAAIFPRVAPDVTRQVKLFVSMKPVDLCMPMWIRERHYDGILAGVMGAIYLMPGPNYKDDLGARMEKRFRAYIARAIDDALVSGTDLTHRVRPPTIMIGSQR